MTLSDFKVRFPLLKSFAIDSFAAISCVLASSVMAQVAPSQNAEHLRTVSDAYSQCSAYFEVVSNALKNSGRGDLAESALSMKSQSDNLAMIMAQDLLALTEKEAGKIDAGAKQLTQKNYGKALSQLKQITRKGKGQISIVSAKYQKGCQSALSDPGMFSANVLSTIIHKDEIAAAAASSSAPAPAKK